MKEEGNLQTIKIKGSVKVKCMDCHCIGELKRIEKQVYLFPEDVLNIRSIHTQKADLKKRKYKSKGAQKLRIASHGFGTKLQHFNFMIFGFMFWAVVLVATSYISFANSKLPKTYLTSTCQLGYKICLKNENMDLCGHLMQECHETREFEQPEHASYIRPLELKPFIFNAKENEVNLRRCQKKKFFDKKICRHFCSTTLVLESTRSTPLNSCEQICFELTRSSESSGDICPFQKYCKDGCPCQYYDCEKTSDDDQTQIPVWDLESKIEREAETDAIFARLERRKPKTHVFKTVLYDFNLKNETSDTFIEEEIFLHAAGATFLKGEHYLIDAKGQMRVFSKSRNEILTPQFQHVGYFMFHFGSSVGTHTIQLRRKDKTGQSFNVVVICSPTIREDKCFYYAPDYNLKRFESAQGYIASNHFNARQSVVTFQGRFHVMSLRFGDPLIKTSSTMSLNAIRESEEGTKGWKKGELSFPPEFADLDPVHILPLLDLGRLLIVLVTRSIALSNTQYSLLLESEGRLLNLGSEWIGSRVKYQTRADCFSQMLALKDFYFTDNWGVNNDECEYFPNGFVLNDRIYLQSVVFDTTFELEMNFDFFDIEFYQLEETNRIHVSSNPQFAFHDDIFPTFAKNLFIQEEFPPPAFPRIHSRERTTHVPDLLFSSLAAFDHISSVVFDFAGVFVISFDLQWFHRIQKTTKVLELRLLGDEIFILLELLPDGTVQFSSSYLEEKVKIKKKVAFQEIFSIEIKINFNTTPTIQFCDSQKHQLRSLVLLKEQTMKIYKFGEETKIKKLATFVEKKVEDFMLVLTDDFSKSILFSGNGSYVASPTVFSPSNVFIQGSLNTVFQDNLYIFGGFIDGSKTAQLEGCEMIELKQRLVFDVESYFADVVPIKDETEVLLCFTLQKTSYWMGNDGSEKKCQIWNGSESFLGPSLKHGHITGKLGVYNGRPTAVGGNFFNERKTFYDSTRAIESLNETGEWFTVAKLPIKLGYFSVVSLESGALLIIDFPANCRIQRIYYLRNGEWIPKGKINLKYRDGGITKRIGSSIYFFPENQYYAGTQGSSPPTDVQKIELVDEEISSVEKIGEIRDYETILVFQTYAGYCVYN